MTLQFTVDARDPREHVFRLTLELDAPPASDLELFHPTWTPGSYLIREHQRHLGEFVATDAADGATLLWKKSAKNRFAIRLRPGTRRVRVRYLVYAHELSVRTAHFTSEHAFWNGVSLFLWPVHQHGASADIDVLLPAGWQLWCSLPSSRDGDRVRLHAENHDALVDAPVLASAAAKVVEFEVMGRAHRFVFDGLESVPPPASLAADTKAVIEHAARVFDVEELPYARYDFLTLVSDGARGGLEHADCSVLLASRIALAQGKGYREFLGLVAHEHFHVFNVKRMRPAELWQLDYERENHTRLLWVAEGFTAYYDDLLCRRAGVLSGERYLQIVADNISDAHRTPGRLVHSLAETSYDAWIKFYRPDEDIRNSSQSYYVNGALAAMCLDLMIRDATGSQRSLDDAMARLWRRTWLERRGFTHADVVEALSFAMGRDMAGVVTSLVEGPFDPDFASVLATAGLSLKAPPVAADAVPELGLELRPGTTVIANVRRGDCAARAALAAGDEVLAMRGLRVSAGTWDDTLRAVHDGTPIPFLIARQGAIREVPVSPDEPASRLTYKIEPDPNATAAQTAVRRAWLGDDSVTPASQTP